MQILWNRLEAWLAIHLPEILPDLNSPASDTDISELEGIIGKKLPQDFVDSLKIHNGQTDNFRSLFPSGLLLSTSEIASQWAIWKDLLDGGDFEGCESEPSDARVRNDWWNSGWIPITYDGGGNHDCLDLNPASGGSVGQIISMWHDMPYRELQAENFYTWLEQHVSALESGELSYSTSESCWINQGEASGA
jgi:cell wall assembly regulator SMI1